MAVVVRGIRLARFGSAVAVALVSSVHITLAGAVIALTSPFGSTADPTLDRVLRERLLSRPLCVVAIAGDPSTESIRLLLDRFQRRAGREAITVFDSNGVDARSSELPETVAALARCGGVIIAGSDPSRLIQTLRPGGRDSALLRGVRALLDVGGVVVGLDQMATTLGDARIVTGSSRDAMRFGVVDRPDRSGLVLEYGLGLAPHLLFDIGCSSRGYVGRSMVALAERRELQFGIGMDESSAVVLVNDVWEILGDAPLLILDTSHAGHWNDDSGIRDGELWLLTAGDRFEKATNTARAAMAKLPLGPTRRRPRIPEDPWAPTAFLHLLAGTASLGEAQLKIPTPGRMLALRVTTATTVAGLRGRDALGLRRGFFAGPIAWDLIELSFPSETRPDER